ncbi:MAG TPA: pyridoxamine 5'-phosphate oxidase family protein [Terriglobales bacterium]|nr:pyridoxamine 5'-phosphate oxidase family protein [Terriglobales bacterium]
MEIREMDEKDCRAVLQRAALGRLGCSLDNQPYVVPVYFAYEAGYLYSFSTLGQKIDWMRSNPKVCLQVDEMTSDAEWASVIANGRYQELAEPQHETEIAHARQVLEKHHRWWLNAIAERRLRMGDQFIEPLFFRIQVDSLSGLAAHANGESSR